MTRTTLFRVFPVSSGRLAVALAALLATPGVPLRAADAYVIDGVHSTMVFKVKHLNVANFYGRFAGISGKIVLDAESPAKSSVEVEVKAESVDTANEKRDQHLKGPDFFSVKQFPTITFKSKSLKKVSETAYEVTGELTLHGVTKELTIQLEQTGSAQVRGSKVAGFATSFKIKRSDFGMKYGLEGVSDEVEITAGLEGSAK